MSPTISIYDENTRSKMALVINEHNVTTVNKVGRTFLHRAVWHNSVKQVRDILAYGVDVDLLDHYQETALDIAYDHHYIEIFQLLLKKVSFSTLNQLLSRSTMRSYHPSLLRQAILYNIAPHPPLLVSHLIMQQELTVRDLLLYETSLEISPKYRSQVYFSLIMTDSPSYLLLWLYGFDFSQFDKYLDLSKPSNINRLFVLLGGKIQQTQRFAGQFTHNPSRFDNH